ncbi:hypothetical protein JCM4814A_35320 [Streptomyces phaeofaciens JCM 4814]
MPAPAVRTIGNHLSGPPEGPGESSTGALSKPLAQQNDSQKALAILGGPRRDVKTPGSAGS